MRTLTPGLKLFLSVSILCCAFYFPKPAEADIICNRYGTCQYCDFYSSDGTYLGHMTDCP